MRARVVTDERDDPFLTTLKVERVVLNALAKHTRLCRLISAPTVIYLASSSEKPIHLSRATSLLQDRDDLRLNWLPGDFDVFIRNVNVNFRSNTKLSFEINAGLD